MKTHQVRALARAATAVVLAAASAAVFANNDNPNNGAMTFANVNVVNAPAPAGATDVAGSAGMRAQKDQDTGELRAPTASEAAELDAHSKAKMTSPVAQVTLRTLPNGIHAATLTEEFMSYEVVQKDANGKLVQQCTTGESSATHALQVEPVALEVQNDR
jgi:hypothetical protein